LLTYEGVYPTTRANAFLGTAIDLAPVLQFRDKRHHLRVLPHVIRLWLHPGYSLTLWKLSEWDVITGHPDVHRGSHANLLVSAST